MNVLEYYHNSQLSGIWRLPPIRQYANAFVLLTIDKYLKSNSLYKKDEKKITFADVEDSLILVINSFSTVTSYENQTKKSITNKFIQEAMTEFFRRQLEIYFIENKMDADKIAAQVLANKRSRETAENTRVNIRK